MCHIVICIEGMPPLIQQELVENGKIQVVRCAAMCGLQWHMCVCVCVCVCGVCMWCVCSVCMMCVCVCVCV